MYHLSRSLYRDLTPMLAVPVRIGDGHADRQELLELCEAAVRRMVFEPDSHARPAQALFGQIRHMFPVDAQADVWSTVRVHVEAATSLAGRLETVLRRDCQAMSGETSLLQLA